VFTVGRSQRFGVRFWPIVGETQVISIWTNLIISMM
jgi:hypothetical protein